MEEDNVEAGWPLPNVSVSPSVLAAVGAIDIRVVVVLEPATTTGEPTEAAVASAEIGGTVDELCCEMEGEFGGEIDDPRCEMEGEFGEEIDEPVPCKSEAVEYRRSEVVSFQGFRGVACGERGDLYCRVTEEVLPQRTEDVLVPKKEEALVAKGIWKVEHREGSSRKKQIIEAKTEIELKSVGIRLALVGLPTLSYRCEEIIRVIF